MEDSCHRDVKAVAYAQPALPEWSRDETAVALEIRPQGAFL